MEGRTFDGTKRLDGTVDMTPAQEAQKAWEVYQQAANAGKGIVIGHDSAPIYASGDGWVALRGLNWSPAINDAFIDGALDARLAVKLVTPFEDLQMVNIVTNQLSITWQEVLRVVAAGGKLIGGRSRTMSDEISKVLGDAVDAFLETVPAKVCYRGMGGDVEIPTPAELSLVRAFEASPPRSREDLIPIARRLNLHKAYVLGAFALRMAVLAARSDAIRVLRSGIFGLVIDDDLIDYRDVLVVLSAIEDCSHRLGTDLKTVVEGAASVATERRYNTIVNDYLARPPGLRGLQIMRIEALGDGDKLEYRARAQ
jgi:hypothetical protein